MNKRKSKAKFMKLDVRMPRELLKQVWDAAGERKCTASDVVCAALAEHFAKDRECRAIDDALGSYLRGEMHGITPAILGGTPLEQERALIASLDQTPGPPAHDPEVVTFEQAAIAEFPDLVAYYEQNGGEAWAAMTWEQRYEALKELPR